MIDTQKALDDARAEIANLSILYEHAKAERDAAWQEVKAAWKTARETAREESRHHAELFKLRPVVEAARGLVAGADTFGGEGAWWADDCGPDQIGCAHCYAASAVHPELVDHFDRCPAIALEQALAALDAGEDES